MRYFLLIILFPVLCNSQSLVGTNGLFKTPSAYVGDDSEAFVGLSFLPRGTYDYLDKGYLFDGVPSFINISFFDRAEVMFRYTHQIGHEISPQTRYFPDRMFAVRYNLLKESVKVPAVSIGLHDFSEALGGSTAAPWFLATYIVGSKTFNFSKFSLSSSLGYGFDLINSERDLDFMGFFGGVELRLLSLPRGSFIFEYDSYRLNMALKVNLIDRFYFSLGLMDLNLPAGYFVYRFNLN